MHRQIKMCSMIFLSAAMVLLTACSMAQPTAHSTRGVGGESTHDSNARVELTVSAAASLAGALKEIQPLYEAKQPVKINLNLGASGSLQRQIEQGAPVDVFLSAGSDHMAALISQGLVNEGRQRNLVTNQLVLIAPSDSAEHITAMADLQQDRIQRIAVGEPSTVPAGRYAREALGALGLWEPLQASIVLTKDVRQVLTYVESGNADAGFVYRTDALNSAKVKVVQEVDAALHSPIRYPVGIVSSTSHRDEAQAFYEYLQSKEAVNVLTRYGFTPPKETS
ncbi:molybdate ABC transporter substrate-binding protein [Paenibacillus xerothermodurans]|uniref:Molybdate ABC transporter substrate-binding protein n=1 Tax=Paenibacillus xerothermodurans TaxID=1977292 RepID=A0A2W1NY30_PAEXE|nr:molybdate ABC transporter substrate-binding protein [Paenibacillus xerothermodurans]PZE19758.1 molybdate ABC transporter substrate-binding protein [Paenibacillus xerothermodurans]